MVIVVQKRGHTTQAPGKHGQQLDYVLTISNFNYTVMCVFIRFFIDQFLIYLKKCRNSYIMSHYSDKPISTYKHNSKKLELVLHIHTRTRNTNNSMTHCRLQ